ncbi:helix-turn-helix protein [Paenibacillus konkukensis]|uniref:Helix-turn-helix protein n=1 Tax=Paenibacillus konkukensis TaxID=2020716 RepID=A0ABY4RNY2_9BACL|nr:MULTISPECIES: helix-turn-helix transcriptional regulator [Paenibacillus]UQZ83293.1 helix-turn-helix protein [Paenibacillus konkukensis]
MRKKRELTPVGKVVKKRLIEVGITHRQLAQKIGTSEQYLNSILFGARSGRNYLPKIARVLDLDLESLKVSA